jgi:hypothetical protein
MRHRLRTTAGIVRNAPGRRLNRGLGVQKDSVQVEARREPLSCAALGWLMVLNPARIEAHPFYFGLRAAIVLCANGVVQEKFGPAFRAVDLDRQHRRWTDEYSILALFSDHEGSLLDTQAAAEPRGQDDRAAAANFAGERIDPLAE